MQLSLFNRCSVMSDTDTESIFMDPIHLSSSVAAKQIIKEGRQQSGEGMNPRGFMVRESLMGEWLHFEAKD